MNQQDWDLVKLIKEKVRQLPDLEVPPSLEIFIVLEVDGCMSGWGGICKWKPQKNDPRSTEKICAYTSGKFCPIKSTIDAEIHAVMKTMEGLKIYYLDKKEIIIRTDCQEIISFFNKSAQNKSSRVRMEERRVGPATHDFRGPLGTQGKAQSEGRSPSPLNSTQSLVEIYRAKVEEINEETKPGLRLDILHEVEEQLGQIQREAAQQSIKSLQQYREIHSIKLREYRRRSTRRNWHGDRLPVVQQQDDQLEQALWLVKDVAQRTPSFSI
ncbi:hypothetical protein ZIOFF_047518 [Zingiber officinale]|uniref:Reverse transcriptase RNase H-like domain-containing protein n=1 Tax=Zingiber officinale TaxID=94328 RepID=A0A8J5FTB6_ZINOF|nr:hypothetical protein ZIOFF_047518 [Zingiber officinale]